MSTDDKPTGDPPSDPSPDPLIEAQIERSIRKYVPFTPPALLEVMRETLRDVLTHHPTAIGLLDQLRARGAPGRSGEVLRDGAEPESEAGMGKAK